MAASYQFGIEEELFLADAETRGTPKGAKPFHQAVHTRMPEVERELLEAQLEIMTPPCVDFEAARTSLAEQRQGLANVGKEHAILILASGTHPTARWKRQNQTNKARYDTIGSDMKMLARRDVVCGMHVHVEVPEPDRRVDLMNRLLPYTPILLALSASSPFWQGTPTGLNAYRLSVWGEMPRTGLPELFADQKEYERLVATMVRSGAISDASFLWWTLRPSIRFPTLELRVADSCTRLEDTLTIAAIYRCLVRRLDLDRSINVGLTSVSRGVATENMWRAQRDGIHASFIDEEGSVTTFADRLEQLLSEIAEHADALGCAAEVSNARDILVQGTSADRQLSIFDEARAIGRSKTDALIAVVDWMGGETAA